MRILLTGAKMPCELPVFPDWGADQPPEKSYEKQYVTGPQGDMHAGEVLCEVQGVQVLRCHPCVGIHLFPVATDDELDTFYRDQFYQEVKPTYLATYEEDRLWWEQCVHGPLLHHCQALLRGAVPPARVSMLDIGAGPGIALDVGKQQYGWDTYAIEPNALLARRLVERGHQVALGSLVDRVEFLRYTWPPFDVLYLYEVFEHIPTPEVFLDHCHALLAPYGVLVIAVPNDFTPAQYEVMRRYDLPPWFVAVPDHQQYFSPITLKLLLRRCGFHIRYARMTFPLIEEFILQDGLCYVNNPALGRACHQERMRRELAALADGSWPALEAQYIANVETRTGREIILIATKDG
jgi:2-polyprenyl-3-methyl-5-hydroxy-6-metoxy-1,4-benzoquinol methylase